MAATGGGEGDQQASKALVPVLVVIGMVTSVVSSLGAPLLPTIARADHVSLGDAEWSLTITMLVGAVAAPVIGRLGDGPWRRSVILASLAVVVAGSVLAALPGGGFAILLVGRGMHGFGMALMPLTMAVARDSLPPSRSGPAIALLSISTAAGVGLGYPITGLLDQSFGLHSAFWFGAVVGIIALALSIPVIPGSDHLRRRPLDSFGAAFLGLALLGILLGVSEGQPWGWGSLPVLGLMAGGVALAVVWVAWETRVRHPLVDLGLLRHASVTVTNLTAMLIAMAMYMYIPLMTDFVQTPRSAGYGAGASVLVTGLMLVPFSVLSTSMSRLSAAIANRVGAEWVVAIGSLVTMVAVGMFAVTSGSLWQAFVDMGIAGIGVGFTFAAMPGIIVGSVPGNETGSALGFYQVVRYVGFSMGSAVAATVLAAYTPAGRVLPQRTGFTVALALGSVVCLGAAAVSAALGRRMTARPDTTAAVPPPPLAAEVAGVEILFE